MVLLGGELGWGWGQEGEMGPFAAGCGSGCARGGGGIMCLLLDNLWACGCLMADKGLL